MRFAHTSLGAMLSLCMLLRPVVVAADDAPATPSAGATPAEGATAGRDPLEVAREHMERGQALYEAGRYIESAEEFLRAYDAQPFSAFLYNAAVAYEKLGEGGRAADFFERFLASEPGALGADKLRARIARLRGPLPALPTAEPRAESFKSLLSIETTPTDATVTIKDAAGTKLRDAAAGAGPESIDPGSYFVEVQHPKYKTIATPITIAAGKVYVIIVELSQGQFLGLLRVESDVPGAEVYVDRRDKGALGRTPLSTAIKTGAHHLWIARPGYQLVERDVEVGVGDDVLVDVALARVDYGRIRVVANRPDADVFVDGVAKGRVPLEVDVDDGAHEVRVTAPGMKDWTTRVSVARGKATPLRVRMRPTVGRAGAFITAGLSAAIVGGSIAVAAVGKRTVRALDDDRRARTLESDDARARRAKWLYVSADVGFGVGALLAGLATYYFLRDPLPDSDGRVLAPRDWAFSPDLGPARGGARFLLSF